MNFTITWLFDKLGYMPKINMEVGKINFKAQEVWPFPVEQPKPAAKKRPAAKKPALKKATTRKPKAK
jgi:hypothetical protein